MAKFSIYSSNGSVIRYTGTPTYNGTYMKPAYVEFREIASDVPIDWQVGDYVDYSRTGMRYKLYSIPQPTKNARSGQSGKAYVYQNVQFFAETKKLEIALFRDLVPLDNQIHFSTQQAISVYDDVAGIAERLQACMDDYDPNNWEFKVVDYGIDYSYDYNADYARSKGSEYDYGGQSGDDDYQNDYLIQEYVNFIKEDREFTMSGGTVLDALQQIYEVWDNIGWTHTIEKRVANNVEYNVNVITIGKTLYLTQEIETIIFKYGRGMGLRTIKKSQANKDEMATRLYVYGSNKNMYPGYYRGKPILDASSVDIQNLMLPIDTWGQTTDPDTQTLKPDAKKAYIQDSSAIAKFGLIPRCLYFDGGDNEEIYPSIKNVTIGDVKRGISAITDPTERAKYKVPSSSIYPTNSERVDEIKVAVNPTDDGSQTAGGSQYLDVVNVAVTGQLISVAFTTDDEDFVSKTASTDPKAPYTMQDLPDSIVTISEGIASGRLEVGVNVYATVSMVVEAGGKEIYSKVLIANANNDTFLFTSPEIKKNVDEDSAISFHLVLSARIRRTQAGQQGANLWIDQITQASGDATYSFYHNLPPSFSLTLKQIGFSIGDRAALGEGKTVHLLDGKCAGRSFKVKKVLYQSATDDWFLQMYRGYDEDLSMYFPNSNYQIAAGDHFVLLDIAMPELYITMASNKLYNKGLDMLSKTARIEPYYEPEIDAIQMTRNLEDHPYDEQYILREGKYFLLYDEQVTDNDTQFVLIDTLTINEGETQIPTYKVTLREKKKITFQQSTANTIKTLEQKVVDSSGTLKAVNTASTDYNDIENKPQIDSVELLGNMDSYNDLGLISKSQFEVKPPTEGAADQTTYLLAKYKMLSSGYKVAGESDASKCLRGNGTVSAITVAEIESAFNLPSSGLMYFSLGGNPKITPKALQQLTIKNASNVVLGTYNPEANSAQTITIDTTGKENLYEMLDVDDGHNHQGWNYQAQSMVEGMVLVWKVNEGESSGKWRHSELALAAIAFSGNYADLTNKPFTESATTISASKILVATGFQISGGTAAQLLRANGTASAFAAGDIATAMGIATTGLVKYNNAAGTFNTASLGSLTLQVNGTTADTYDPENGAKTINLQVESATHLYKLLDVSDGNSGTGWRDMQNNMALVWSTALNKWKSSASPLADVAFSGNYNDLANKPSDIVTKSGNFIDGNILVADGTTGKAKAVGAATIALGKASTIEDQTSGEGYKIAIVSSMPATPDARTIYILV